MTITSDLSSVTLNGNGTATSFPFNFVVWKESQLKVYVTGQDGTNTETTNWKAALTESGGSVTYPATGGTVLPAGSRITIMRAMPFAQDADFVNGVAFLPEVVEKVLDQQTAALQQLREALARCVAYPPGTASGSVMNSEAFLAAVTADVAAAQEAKDGAAAAAVESSTSASASAAFAALADARKEEASLSALAAAESAAAAADVIPSASTTVEGKVQLATGAEVTDGTATKVVTAETLKGATDLLLPKAGNLAGLADVAAARGNLGLGSAAVKGAGVAAGNVLLLAEANKLPAMDGSLLTGTQGRGFTARGTGQSISASTVTKVLASSATYNPNNEWNTSTSKFTPTVAGRYLLMLTMYVSGMATGVQAYPEIKKNGTLVPGSQPTWWITNSYMSIMCSVIVEANGTTDNFEFYLTVEGESPIIQGADIHAAKV